MKATMVQILAPDPMGSHEVLNPLHRNRVCATNPDIPTAAPVSHPLDVPCITVYPYPVCCQKPDAIVFI